MSSGIGSIRDALADSLFPGTSVLQTRLRYVLFIPWLMQRAASRKSSPAEMSAEFRALEYRLIESLLAGGETSGCHRQYSAQQPEAHAERHVLGGAGRMEDPDR